MEQDFHSEKNLEKVVFAVINTEGNQERLKEVPHREFLDLSVVYRMIISTEENRIRSVLLTTELAEKFGKTEQELFDIAMKNTAKLFPPYVEELSRFLQTKGGISSPFLGESKMYLLTNKNNFYGASCLLYTDLFQEIAEKENDDLYILPSSTMEVLALPVNVMSLQNLESMVFDINMTAVDLEDRLSNCVYKYDREKNTITIAGDNYQRGIRKKR